MREYRLFILVLLLMLSFTIGSVIAQDAESTEEPEATEVVDEAEMTEEAPEATEEPADEEASTDSSTYVVQRGDNLFRIALRFGLTTSQLAEANGIANPSLIFVGQVLTIPGDGEVVVEPDETETPDDTEAPEATETPTATEVPDTDEDVSTSTYVVQPGDTLFRIAVANNTTVATLLSLNSIANPNIIFVGQSINLPDSTNTETPDGDEDTSDEDSDEEATTDESLNVVMLTGVEVLMGDDNIANASLVTQLGVDWVKITVDWAQIEPEEGAFDFEELDATVDAFAPNFGVMLTLTGAPDWSRPSATELALEQPTYGPPDDLETFGTFANTVASRYVGRVDAYEIWFQPNNRLSWMITDVSLRSDGFPDARLSDVRYIDLLEVAFNAINDADENALVITAGLAPTGNNDFYNSIDNFVFFEALLEQGAVNFSDGFGVHIDGFGNAPDATCCGEPDADPEFDESYHFFFADTLDNFREILDRNGGASMPILVTRFGWGTTDGASGDGTDIPYVSLNSDEEQAGYIADAFVAGDERSDIGAMVLYNLNGCTVGNNTSCYYSLIDASGAARTAFGAVASLELSDE